MPFKEKDSWGQFLANYRMPYGYLLYHRAPCFDVLGLQKLLEQRFLGSICGRLPHLG